MSVPLRSVRVDYIFGDLRNFDALKWHGIEDLKSLSAGLHGPESEQTPGRLLFWLEAGVGFQVLRKTLKTQADLPHSPRLSRPDTPDRRTSGCSRWRPSRREHERAPTTANLYERSLLGTSTRRANSTRRSRPRPTKVTSGVRRRSARPRAPDLHDIVVHLADAIAFVRVSQRSLSQLDVAHDDVCFLRKGLVALDAVYTEIDFASIALPKQRPR